MHEIPKITSGKFFTLSPTLGIVYVPVFDKIQDQISLLVSD